MSRHGVLRAALLLAVMLAAGGVAGAQAPAPRIDGDRPECVRVDKISSVTEAGWDHVVAIDNQCSHAVRCRARSDVAPGGEQIDVASRTRRELWLFRGAQVRDFTPRVDCAPR